MPSEESAIDAIRSSHEALCKEFSSNSRGLGVLNDMMVALGYHSERQLMSLSDLGLILDEASARKDIGLGHMAMFALRLKKSASCGHSCVEYLGIGRNPASINVRNCLLVRFGDRVYSYIPTQNVTPIERWDGRLSLLLRAPGGVAAFNKLVRDGVLFCAGPMWDLNKDDIGTLPTRDLVFSVFHSDDEALVGTTLIYSRGEGEFAVPYNMLNLVSAGGLSILRLEGDALLYMIARGYIDLSSEVSVHADMIKLVSKSGIG